MARLTVGGSFGGFLDRVRLQAENLRGRPRLKLTVNNSVFYFEFVEKGTSKMKARAMVRRSIPVIEAFIQNQLVLLGPFFSEAELDIVIRRCEQFALDEILSRTPVSNPEARKQARRALASRRKQVKRKPKSKEEAQQARKRARVPKRRDPDARPGRLRRGMRVKIERV